MANEREFSHITVSADEDDDIVIQAGIVETPADEPEAASPADEAPEPAKVEESVEASVVENIPTAKEAPATGPQVDDGYRETTLEDIESSKMTSVQKAVIVVALLGIVAFAVWFLVAR